MTKQQARKLALWVNGCWLFLTDTTGLDGELSRADETRIQNAQTQIARDMIRRSGIPQTATLDEALRLIGVK